MAHRIRRALGLLLALSGIVLILAPVPSALGAKFEIAPGGFTADILDAEGNPETLAGSHPDRLKIGFALEIEDTAARDLEFELPPGLGGNPAAVPQCARSVYDNNENCPPESQVGTIEVVLPGGSKGKLPLFELEPLPNQAISFGSDPSLDLPLASEIRASDFGVTLKANDLPQESSTGGTFELWGIPADHQEGTGIPRRALLTTPPTCGPLTFKFRTRSWQEGAPWLSASADTAPQTGCQELDFEPKLELQLSNPVADSPTGMRMDLSMPEEDWESERAAAEIKNVTVEMPRGIGISPEGAAGLVACSDAQLGLGTSTEVQCPQAAKLGSAEFSSPALGPPLIGAIYLGQEHPGERLRVFVVVQGSGVVFKSVGTLRVNPVTGRLSTVLEGLPQVPIQRISLIFDGGPQALLASPLACGQATGLARFEPYGGGSTVESTAVVPIKSRLGGGQCSGAAPFAPKLTSETSSPRAGHLTTISTTLRRLPGEQLPKRFSATLPAGMSTALGAIEVCSAKAAAAKACPAASKVGNVLAGIGSGPSPASLNGNLYITDSYRQAPFGMLIEFRGAIGPFDLGVITTRGTAEPDRHSGRLTVSVEGLPEEVDGVPIRFRSIELRMDRAGFIRNPTSCSARSTDATLESQSGALASSSSPLRLLGCNRLGFKPAIRMELVGRKELHAHGSPGLRVAVRMRRGDTNLRGLKLSLPPALKFSANGVREICSHQDATEGACPSGSRVGTASARTPTLSEPLNGSVYLAQPTDNGSPDLWVSLTVMGVHVDMKAETFVRDGHSYTRLSRLPDMPLSALTMRLGGSGARVFSLGVSPCKEGRSRRLVSTIATEGQNGARRTLHSRIGMKARCPSSPRSRAHLPGRRAAAAADTE